MQRNRVTLVLSLMVSLAIPVAYASNYSFLTDSPVSYFTNSDWDLYTSAQKKAALARDGAKITWKNPKTGASGTFIPSNARKENGVLCRNLTVINHARGRSGEGVFKVCKLQNGWKAI